MGLLTIAYIALALILGIWLFSKWSHSYWKRVGLENLEPDFFFGNTKDLLMKRISFADQFKIIYDELKSRGLKHGGLYMSFSPMYMPIDLDIVKNIMQKDFNHFVNHGLYVNEKADPLTGHLFNLEDDRWKKVRAKLTPTFTSGKMKMMFYTLVSCTSGMEDILNDHSTMQDAVDIKDVLSRFTTDVIGSVAFGLECNSLKNPESEFRKWGKKMFVQDFVQRMKFIITLMVPRNILVMLGFRVTPRDIEYFFQNVVKETVQYRESNDVHRKDFMHLLLQLKNRGEVADDDDIFKSDKKEKSDQLMTMDELAAQCIGFFVAGFETSATTMTYALLELALNEYVQEKLREEIKTVLNDNEGQVTYDAIMSMSYLDKVIHETLRKHTPIPEIPRICNKAYKVPGTDVVLKVGTMVQLPVQAIHRDPEYYPEPEKFDPERFNEENKAKRHPFAFLPFGEGPRICLGARFGILEIKVALTAILGKFKVTLNDKTKTPIKYSPPDFISAVEGGVWLNVAKIE